MSSPLPDSPRKRTRRAPTNSFLYERLLPIVFIALAIIMLVLIVIAAGVLLGVVQYR